MGEKFGGMQHMLTTVFLSGFAGFLMRPVIPDVIVAAVCSRLNESCSLAVYLTGLQQVAVGLGTMVMMPVIGNLSDRYGIKAMLTIPMCLSIIPPAILGYKRDTNFFYAYYIVKILFDMICEGTVDCLAYAYVANNINGGKRISVFGVLAGVKTISGVCGTFAARFLPIASTFQVSAISYFIGLVYMRVFLKERLHDDDDDDNDDDDEEEHDGDDLKKPILRDAPVKTRVFNTKYSSFKDMVHFMKTSTIFVQALVVTFFASLASSGLDSAFLYYLKARFGFNKNDFADLILLVSIIGSIAQLFLMPIMVSSMGERRVLSTGLLMEFFNTALVSISWAAWVPYALTVLAPGSMIVMPSICGIASKQAGPGDQGKVQGCISGVMSLGKVVGPFLYSPLTALFLSDHAPFYFPGFSILCIALCTMIAFLQSLFIKDVSGPLLNKTINISKEEA